MGLCEITEGGSAGPVSAFAPDTCMTNRNATTCLGCGVGWVQESGETPLLLRNTLRSACHVLLVSGETGAMAGDPLGYT